MSTKKSIAISLRQLKRQTSSLATLNCALALDKAHENRSFQELVQSPVSVLQGIGPKHTLHWQQLRCHSIYDLAHYKPYRFCKAVQILAATEVPDGRLENAVMNIYKGLDKESQSQSLQELLKCSPQVLFGVSETTEKTLNSLGVHSIKDMANLKYCQWAEAILIAAEFEQI